MIYEDDNGIFLNISQINTGFIDIPGKISINIYTQGCNILCEGCQNTELQAIKAAKSLHLSDIQYFKSMFAMTKWICYLGGEPTIQPNLNEFNKEFKKNGYNICIYTGNVFENITNLLDNVDLVIDGPWKGLKVTESKTNQRVFLKKDNDWTNVKFNDLKELLKENKENDTGILVNHE